MNRKALLVGLNYIGTESELKGCINDVVNIKKLIMSDYGFLENEIILEKYFDLLDTDKIYKIVFEEQCKSVGGIIYDNDKCTLSKDKCTI